MNSDWVFDAYRAHIADVDSAWRKYVEAETFHKEVLKRWLALEAARLIAEQKS